MLVDAASLRVLRYPDPVLRAKAHPLSAVDDTVRAVATRMLQMLREDEGIGLAAPQVGLPWRLFVTNTFRDGDVDRVYINPTLREFSREMVLREEGCLSLPGINAEILRPASLTITATDLDGREFSLTADDMLARVWQHENDHLDGVLIIDRMRPMDRLANRRAVKDLEAAANH
jgi:peptide deformylase